MKDPIKTRWLNREIAYPGPFVALCTKQEQYDAICKEWELGTGPFLLSGADGTMHFYDRGSDAVAIVCIRPKPKAQELIAFGLIVHESVHVWQKYAAWLNETEPGKEQEAYAIQAISQNLMKEFRRQMREVKKCIAKSAEIPLPSLTLVT